VFKRICLIIFEITLFLVRALLASLPEHPLSVAPRAPEHPKAFFLIMVKKFATSRKLPLFDF
jgi:hypothetical protein